MDNATRSKKEQVRLIDAYKLWADIQMLPHNGDIISSEEVEQAIMSAETIDPESLRPQGEWIEYTTRTKSSMFVCSECLGVAYFPQPTRDKKWVKHCGYKYCPNCGAKMYISEDIKR